MRAKRPMIYTGGGVVLGNAAVELAQLVRLLGFPCTNTLMGLGGYPATDRQFVHREKSPNQQLRAIDEVHILTVQHFGRC